MKKDGAAILTNTHESGGGTSVENVRRIAQQKEVELSQAESTLAEVTRIVEEAQRRQEQINSTKEKTAEKERQAEGLGEM